MILCWDLKGKHMLKIRPARTEDAFDIANINTLGWKVGYRGLVCDSILDEMQVTEKRIQRTKEHIANAEIFLVAEQNNKAVGFLRGGKPKRENLPYSYEIHVFYVHPDHWRSGIGTALFNAFKEKIKVDDFCVYALDGNIRGINFYQKMGMKRFAEFDCDVQINQITIHDLFLGFDGEKNE